MVPLNAIVMQLISLGQNLELVVLHKYPEVKAIFHYEALGEGIKNNLSHHYDNDVFN